MSEQPVGHLTQAGYGTYRAVCAAEGCQWTWQGDRETAQEYMQGHATLVHPLPIPVFRPTPVRRPDTEAAETNESGTP